jgi:ATP-dependent exoDNAse (exonuclease V) beta subunit
VYENAFRAEDQVEVPDDESNLVSPSFRRFSTPWRLPAAPALPEFGEQGATDDADDRQVDYYWVGSSARHAGTIVHRWLQQLADGHLSIDENELSTLRPVNQRWSERLGVPSAEIDEVCSRVEEALQGILTDPKGRWSLYGEGQAELPLTGLCNGRVESVVIDRVRIDEDGVHWIVDYKTSTHEGGDLEGFLDQESERYRPQLQKYAALYKALGNSEVRVALYFPLLQEFREVSLD